MLLQADCWLQPLLADQEVRRLFDSDVDRGDEIAMDWLENFDALVTQIDP